MPTDPADGPRPTDRLSTLSADPLSSLSTGPLGGVEARPGVPKPDPLLIVDGIQRTFGGLVAVDVEHLEIQRGVITALIGPNGAGKTTFFNLLTGFDRPDQGRRVFKGDDLSQRRVPPRFDSPMSRAFAIALGVVGWAILGQLVARLFRAEGAAPWAFGALVALGGLAWSLRDADRHRRWTPMALLGAGVLAGELLGRVLARLLSISSGWSLGLEAFTVALCVGGAVAWWHYVNAPPAPYQLARRGMVRTFQLTKSLSKLSVIENMRLGAGRQRGEHFFSALLTWRWGGQEDDNTVRADALLERFKLDHLRNEFAGTLSGGQRKLLEMARALMTEPELVMLDEPMAGVNPALTQSLLGHVKDLRAQGMTVVFVEHDMDVVWDISDWVVVMAEGRVIAEGPPAVIVSNPMVIDAYLGIDEEGEAA